jgi:glycosyltransferase involved in cell wall biosynthesis
MSEADAAQAAIAEPSKDGSARRGHIALAAMSLGGGGAERAAVNLARGFVARGYKVDMIVASDSGSYGAMLPSSVEVHVIGKSPWSMAWGLSAWSQRNPRAVLLSCQANLSRVAGLCVAAGWVRNPLVIREPNVIKSVPLEGQSRLWAPFVSAFYRRASGFIALSQAGREDLAAMVGRAPQDIALIGNGVDQAEVLRRGREPVEEPWFAPDRPAPVVVAAGRLTAQKGFETLLAAMAEVNTVRPARLVILGEGGLRSSLTRRAAELGLAGMVKMPGFVENPYAYMARADLFVLSSRWEGSPNALLEALATGTPGVATDCRSGPREIMTDPVCGRLVPVGDAPAMAKAMLDLLATPGDRAQRMAFIGREHGYDRWIDRYLAVVESVMQSDAMTGGRA